MTFEQAMLNPAEAYKSPADVVSDNDLSREQKIRVLRQWEYDARELEVAEEENMGGGPPDILASIVSALKVLDDNDSGASPTKHGGE